MRFREIKIENFRGITNVHLANLADTVVIAGPNGCGKSSIFDALRLWKSAYAGYQNDELQWWLQEFGLGGVNALARVMQDRSRHLIISATITLVDSEKEWLRANAVQLTREAACRRLVPGYAQPGFHHPMQPTPMLAPHLSEAIRAQEPAIQAQISADVPAFLEQLNQPAITGRLICYPDGRAETINSIALARIFSVYDGKDVGIIDYHGPQRTFAREEVGGISLQIEQYQTQRQQSALYNYANKYSSVKQELASAYVRDLVAKSAGSTEAAAGLGLGETLDELFTRFFPGKKFKGVQPSPDGSVKFEVETPAGSHDINDLSSGEKELLYGYLRLRNYAPQNSIILLDEPELHLNPRLTDGLVDFYHRHVGTSLNNQLWLVTHSDIILRQSVGREEYNVFHMLTAGSPLAAPNQALQVTAESEIQRAVIDIVGDLAAFKPGAKIVFLEGGGDTNVDEHIVTSLFPEFADSVNLVSAGGKKRVQQIATLLEQAAASGAMVGQAFAITDLDSEDISATGDSGNVLCWDRYHIENYLLNTEAISRVIVDLNASAHVDVRPASILGLLRTAAKKTLDALVRHEMEDDSSKLMVRLVSSRSDRREAFDTEKLFERLSESRNKIDTLLDEDLSRNNLMEKKRKLEEKLNAELETGAWIKSFRGREILKVFCSEYLQGIVRYETFRDLIISKMRALNIKPAGMANVLNTISDK